MSLHGLLYKEPGEFKVMCQLATEAIFTFFIVFASIVLAAATKTSGEVRTLSWVAAVFALRPLWWMKSATSPMVMWGLIYLVIFFCSIVWCYEYYEESDFVCARTPNALTLSSYKVTLSYDIVSLQDCFSKTWLFCVQDTTTVLKSRIWFQCQEN